MAISPKDVQDLREKTGAGMMDCKRALEEAGGSLDEAVKILRKKGIATAEKKAMRAASEGLVAACVTDDGKAGSLIEINCETDFVAKTDDFQELVKNLSRQVAEQRPADVDALLAVPYAGDQAHTVKEAIVAKVAKVGENIQFRRLAAFQGDFVASYIHAGGKIGVLMEMAYAEPLTDAVRELAKDLCMQVAASAPRFVSREEVTAEVLESEREIYKAQVLAQGKPANIVDKIVDGKMNKYYEENCLLEQAYVKEMSQRVADTIKARAKDLKVRRFVRYVLGEGIKAS